MKFSHWINEILFSYFQKFNNVKNSKCYENKKIKLGMTKLHLMLNQTFSQKEESLDNFSFQVTRDK